MGKRWGKEDEKRMKREGKGEEEMRKRGGEKWWK
jgi:hypothetical protein